MLKRNSFFLFIIFILTTTIIFSQNNKLFWDGRDWNNIKKKAEHNEKNIFLIKKAYLEGALDGRLFGYLRAWEKNNSFADEVFAETVDYLTIRELIKNIDSFYNDPINYYIPIPSAIIIANLYAERHSVDDIDNYIRLTREWINDLILDLDTLDYSRLLEQKLFKQNKKQINLYE